MTKRLGLSILEQLDTLLEVAQLYSPSYLPTISDSVLRIYDLMLNPLPNLQFLECEPETLEHFHKRRNLKAYYNLLYRLSNPFANLFRKLKEIEYDEDDYGDYDD